jgi:hypothetical protein
MNRTFAWLLVVLVVLAAGYGVMLVVLPEARPGFGGSRRRPPASEARAGGAGTTAASVYETVAVTIEIPAEKDVPTGGTHGGRCPQDQLCNILGVRLAQPHGMVVGMVVPDGPADKAGIKKGDMLSTSGECPSMALNRFLPRSDAREVKLTVRRRVSSTEGETEKTGSEQPEARGE